MSLFTGSYPDPLNATANILMQAAMDTTKSLLAATNPPVDDLALMVVVLTGFEGRNDHPWAGTRMDEEHYSASLLKAAAMYAAFDLRSSADQLATDNGLTTWPAIESALISTFNPEIDTHTPSQISGSPLLRPEDKARKPNYSAVLQLGAGPDFVVDFTPTQLNAFEDMIVHAHNAGATTTIHGLGYPYLNGKIADDGFFEVDKGVWLAGDYTFGAGWPAARIPSKNDGPSAQATTATHLARLLTLLFDNRLVGSLSSAAMQDLMGRAGKWFHFTDIIPPTIIWPLDGRFIATHSKVGVGPMKAGGLSGFSEGLVVRDTMRDIDFVVVWQNAQDTLGAGGKPFRRTFEPVATIIEATISAFVP
jgi:hypothetical protein